MGWREPDELPCSASSEWVPASPPPLGSLDMAGMSYGEPRRAEHGLEDLCLALPKQRRSTGQCREAVGITASIGLSRVGRWICVCAEGTGRRRVELPKSRGLLAPKSGRRRWSRDEWRLWVGRKSRAAAFNGNHGTRNRTDFKMGRGRAG